MSGSCKAVRMVAHEEPCGSRELACRRSLLVTQRESSGTINLSLSFQVQLTAHVWSLGSWVRTSSLQFNPVVYIDVLNGCALDLSVSSRPLRLAAPDGDLPIMLIAPGWRCEALYFRSMDIQHDARQRHEENPPPIFPPNWPESPDEVKKKFHVPTLSVKSFCTVHHRLL